MVLPEYVPTRVAMKAAISVELAGAWLILGKFLWSQKIWYVRRLDP